MGGAGHVTSVQSGVQQHALNPRRLGPLHLLDGLLQVALLDGSDVVLTAGRQQPMRVRDH